LILVDRLMQDAILFANQYESCDYFGHSMEILVHRALEEECETKIGFHESKSICNIIVIHDL
jgi:hypothetical protein